MKKDIVISNMMNGMGPTPIAQLVQVANQFDSRIYFEMDTKKVNAKSIMGMMSLVLSTGSAVSIIAEGDDEEQAIAQLEEFLTAQ